MITLFIEFLLQKKYCEVPMVEKKETLEEKINQFRLKLDSMLETQPVNSCEVLKLSKKLDLLIADYYSKKVV